MGSFDDLIPGQPAASGNAMARGGRRSPSASAFDDLVPRADSEGQPSTGAFDDLVPAVNRGPTHVPQPPANVKWLVPPAGATQEEPGFVGNAMNTAREFGKGIVRGAADLYGTGLKWAGAAQTIAARGMLGYTQRRLDAIARIDRGETVDPAEDPEGYADKPPAEREAIRQRLTSRLTQFDLPGGAADRDLYKAGEWVSEAGRRVAPAGPGWDESITAQLGQGVGSVAAGLPVAAAGRGAAALVFGGAGGGEALERAIQDKASPDDQLKAAILGVAPGMTDVAPIELLLRSNRVTGPVSRPLASALARIGGQAFVEGIQEGGQQFLQNLIAREIYKPEQSLSEGVVPNTALGGGVGGITATAVELARLFGSRRAPHVQPPPLPSQGEVGSATDVSAAALNSAAGGVAREWVGETGRNAMTSGPAPAAARDAVPSGASGAFNDLIPGAGNGPISSDDNVPFRQSASPSNAMAAAARSGPPPAPSSNAMLAATGVAPSLPDFGLSKRGDQLAYGGSGEAPGKSQRRVDRTSLQVEAERLMRDVSAYHAEGLQSGASPQAIADGLAETFGIEVSPADVASGNVWWQVPQAGSIAPPENFAPRLPAPLAASQRAEVLRLAAEGSPTAAIAQQLGLDPLTVGATIQAAKPRPQRRPRTSTMLSDIEGLYAHNELAGLNARDAAARLSGVLGHPVSEAAVYRARHRATARGAELPPLGGRSRAGWSDEALNAMLAAEQEGLPAPAIASLLNERFPGFRGRLTPNAIRLRRSKMGRGLSAGGRSEAIGRPGPDVDALARQPALADSEYSDELAALRMITGPDSKRISDARYARLLSKRLGRDYTAAEARALRERAREASRHMGVEPHFAIGSDDADLTRSTRKGWARPINWDAAPIRALLEGRGSARERHAINWDAAPVRRHLSQSTFRAEDGTMRLWHPGVVKFLRSTTGRLSYERQAEAISRSTRERVTRDQVRSLLRQLRRLSGHRTAPTDNFDWPPEALEMIRAAEGRLSFDELASEMSLRFGRPITRAMIAGKVSRLRALGSRRDAPMLAASDDPEGWLARFRSALDARRTDPATARTSVDREGGAVPEGPPREGAVAGLGPGRDATGGAAGRVGGFSLGRYSGLVVETPSVSGNFRQRRYYLYPENAQVPSVERSPQVALRVARSSRNWVAKAHLVETEQGWQVLGVNVRNNRQRRGIGTDLYDALSRDVGAELGPSPSMSRKLFRFWQKRDGHAVANYQRIGETYHSPAALRSMKRVNDELLRNPPTPRDAAYARRFSEVIDRAVARAEGLPRWSVSDIDGRRHVAAFVRAGRTVTIPEHVIGRMLEAIEKAAHRLPEGTSIGALARVAPLKGSPFYPGADAVATFRQPNGETFEIELPLRLLAGARALYDNFTGAIGLTRFGLFGGLDQSVAGEINHEAVHALRRQGRLVGPLWDRLVSHANKLRLLDGSLATYLKMVGDPAASKADPETTLREAYEDVYHNTTDFSERMDQEAVAHMVELYSHGALLPQETEPVQAILDDLIAGRIATEPSAQNQSGSSDDIIPDSSIADLIPRATEETNARGPGAFDDLIPGNRDYREKDYAIADRRGPNALGYTSKLDQVLDHLLPTDTVTAKTLQRRGVKQTEMQARGIADLLEDGKAAKVSDLRRIAGEHQVSLSEVRYGLWSPERQKLRDRLDELRDDIAVLDREHYQRTGMFSSNALKADPRYRVIDAEFRDIQARLDQEMREAKPVRWYAYSLDPSNPTYRKTVLHLGRKHGNHAKMANIDEKLAHLDPGSSEFEQLLNEKVRLSNGIPNFRSGHFSEPNIVAHARTSLLKDAQGRTVFHIDELQSDWGQKLRDGGARDEAKIADLGRRRDDALARLEREAASVNAKLDALGVDKVPPGPHASQSSDAEIRIAGILNEYRAIERSGDSAAIGDFSDIAGAADELQRRLRPFLAEADRINAEIDAADAASPGHPLVNTTDQWVNTALRRLIRQAVDAGADYIAVPSGETVLNYGMGGKADGVRYAYDRMYPKNLRNILRRMDGGIDGHVTWDLRNPDSGSVPERLSGATVFPLPNKVKGEMIASGQPMFALSADHPRVTTPGGEMEVAVQPEIVELADLRQATGDLQPRDRSRAESAIGVRQRAALLDPTRLMPERVSDNGAPVVTEDNTILSGNGRVLSIGEAYQSPALADRANEYREAVIAYARREGLGSAAENMRQPVLVSRIAEDLSHADLVRFADLSNRSAIAQMSSPERAMRDARALGPVLLGAYRGGDFTSVDNREFYRAFMDEAVSATERGGVSRDGVLTKEGEDRMSAAVLAGAYGDPALLSRMLEATDDNIRSVTGALRDAAGAFVRLKMAIDAGEVDRAFDITPQIAEAARRIADLRSRRVSLPAFLAQQDAFSRLDPIVEDLLRGFHNESLTRARSREKLTELLASYAEEAVKHKQNGLIPDETSPATIVAYAARRAAQTGDELVAGSTGAPGRPHDRARTPDRGPQPVGNRSGQGGEALPQGLTPSNAMLAGQRAGNPSNAMSRFSGRPGRAAGWNAMSMGPPVAPPAIPPAQPPSAPPPGVPPLPLGGGRGAPNPATIRALNSWKTRLLETFQNSQERARILVDRVGQGRLADSEDPYLKATLYHGRLDARVRFGNEMAEEIVFGINAQARVSRLSHDDMRQLVNDYLVATHAPERNAIHGDGAAGMTNAEAHQALARLNARADASAIRSIAARVRSLHEMSLDALRGAGVISDDLYTRLRNTYQHHVPLNRLVPDQADVAGGIAGKGFDVYSSGIKRAKGSDLEVLDVLGNVLSNFEQAMVRSEKNLVDLSTLAFLRGHQTDLAGFMDEQRPPVIGTSPSGQPIYQQTSDPRVLHLFENGKPLWIRFSEARLAAAFKASNSESLPSVLRWVATITRFYSGLQTRFNPEFAFPNKIRDLQETIAYMGAQRQIGARGAVKVLARDPSSTKAVLEYLAGRNTAGARLYQEMVNAGGTTGGMGLSTRASVQLKIDDLDRLAQSSPRKFARRVVDLVDNWNTIFEDSTRLSVYRAALDRGLSKERAAFLAKEASINFNRMGTAGPVVNGLYMFANASIQGSVKMIRSMRNPKVAAAVGVTIAAAVAAVSEWNDEIDPEWRDKVSKWDRLNSLPIVLPNEKGEGVRYVSIPVSWGMKPIMVGAAAAYDAARGIAVDWATALSDITTAMIEAYNPVGGTDLAQAITPTVGDLPLDITRNRKWSGSLIRPDQDRNRPYDKQYFLSLKDTKSGRAAIRATELLHDYTGIELSPADLAYAVEQLIGGTGRSARKTFDTLIGVGTGNPPPADEFPMLSRFYRERSQEEVGRDAGGKSEELSERLRQQSRARFNYRSHVDDILRGMEGMTPAKRREALKDYRDDRALFNDLRSGLRLMERGLNWQERQMLRLGVENGERARFIAEELQPMSVSARTARIRDLRKKEVITPEVLRQIRAHLAGRVPRVTPQQPTPGRSMEAR